MSELTNIMRAATENMLNIVTKYKGDLGNFNTNMTNKIAETERNLAEIKKNWNDGNFESFNKVVKEKLKKLNDQIARSKNLEVVIKETEKDFRDALSELK